MLFPRLRLEKEALSGQSTTRYRQNFVDVALISAYPGLWWIVPTGCMLKSGLVCLNQYMRRFRKNCCWQRGLKLIVRSDPGRWRPQN